MLPSLVKPDRVKASPLESRHDNIDVIVSQPQRRPVRVPPRVRIGRQLQADGVELGLAELAPLQQVVDDVQRAKLQRLPLVIYVRHWLIG